MFIGIMYSVAVFQNMINDPQGVWHFCASHILDNVKHWWTREFLSPQQLQTTWNWQSNQLQHEQPKNPSGNPSGLNSPSDINPENPSHETPPFLDHDSWFHYPLVNVYIWHMENHRFSQVNRRFLMGHGIASLCLPPDNHPTSGPWRSKVHHPFWPPWSVRRHPPTAVPDSHWACWRHSPQRWRPSPPPGPGAPQGRRLCCGRRAGRNGRRGRPWRWWQRDVGSTTGAMEAAEWHRDSHGKSPFLIGKPSISMGHLYHGSVK